jgi:2-C-methyl-D-erythritol 4-phosphate cytidylyltransferase
VLAAGRGERMDTATPKALVPFDGATMVTRAVERASAAASVSGVVVVAPPGWEEAVREAVEDFDAVVPGGETRQASVRAGLSAVGADIARILCHDAARPRASSELFSRALEALHGWDGVVPVLRVVDTVKRVQDGRIKGTEARDALALAQTPQAFTSAALRDAHERAVAEGFEGSDDALLLERAGYRVRAIDGERTNLKITTAEDLRLAEALPR